MQVPQPPPWLKLANLYLITRDVPAVTLTCCIQATEVRGRSESGAEPTNMYFGHGRNRPATVIILFANPMVENNVTLSILFPH